MSSTVAFKSFRREEKNFAQKYGKKIQQRIPKLRIFKFSDRWMDGRTDGRMDGWVDGWMDG